MPGNDRVLIENLKKRATAVHRSRKGAESTELKFIGSMKKRCIRKSTAVKVFLNAMARPRDGDCLPDGHGKRLLR
ncbi:hypothetical protein ACVXG9_01960 [Escherichia coli]